MQITVKIPDKLGNKFNKKEREKIVINALKNKVKPKKSLKEEPFFKWALSPKKTNNIETRSDVSRKHDKYLYGENK